MKALSQHSTAGKPRGRQRGNGFKPFEGKPTEHHSRITDSMMNSPAWKDLSITARYLYLEFKKRYKGHEDQPIVFPYKEARMIMNGGTYSKAKEALISHGFIVVVEKVYMKSSKFQFSPNWKLWPDIRTIGGYYTEPCQPAEQVKSNA